MITNLLSVSFYLCFQSKSVQLRTKKGHEGEEHCNDDEVSTSQLQPNEKLTEESSEEVDPHTQGHMVNMLLISCLSLKFL